MYRVVEFDDESHSSGGAPGPGVEDGQKVRRDSESFIARDESLLISPPDSYQLSG